MEKAYYKEFIWDLEYLKKAICLEKPGQVVYTGEKCSVYIYSSLTTEPFSITNALRDAIARKNNV